MAARELSVEIEIDAHAPEQAHAPSAAPSPPRVGGYRLLAEIATGGMATVYLALPDGAYGLDDMVAVKRVHPHLASQRAFVEMFLDEARIASRIDHANVCRVLDYGHAGGGYFLAMDYLRGCSIARVRRALSGLAESERESAVPIVAARIVCDAARGLHAAHELRDERGVLLEVVHRDVSPHNLFVGWDGTLSVVDFGVASARDRLHHTETGTVKGKFAYMAPEQMVGARVDRRADVWSLGVVLWELLAGQALFKRKTETETVMAVTRLERPPLRALVPWIPAELEAVVDRALGAEPGARYATAAELADELDVWLARQPGPADAAEVGAWMRRLFPGEPEEEERMVRSALAQALPAYDSASTEELSAVVRRKDDHARAAPMRAARIGLLYLFLLALAVSIGAIAALWPAGSAPARPEELRGPVDREPDAPAHPPSRARSE